LRATLRAAREARGQRGEYHCRPLNLLISKRIQNKSKFRIKIGKINRELFRK
jgi:hypothetical protein